MEQVKALRGLIAVDEIIGGTGKVRRRICFWITWILDLNGVVNSTMVHLFYSARQSLACYWSFS